MTVDTEQGCLIKKRHETDKSNCQILKLFSKDITSKLAPEPERQTVMFGLSFSRLEKESDALKVRQLLFFESLNHLAVRNKKQVPLMDFCSRSS